MLKRLLIIYTLSRTPIHRMTNQFIQEQYEAAGQAHLFKHLNTLSASDKATFFENLTAVAQRESPSELLEDCQTAIKLHEDNTDKKSTLEPLPSTSYSSVIGNPQLEEEYYNLGHKAISAGEVAIILMAGGQGTRLGSSQPKGCFDINLPSHKSLFQIQAEKIITLQRLCNDCTIPWYIMTSAPTRAATELFFRDHKYFNLKKDQIVFFNQGTLPAFDEEGKKLLLANPTSLVESPDGNGGLYRAIRDNGIFLSILSQGALSISYMYCVDNVLSKLADPVFIGFAIKHDFQLATKAVRKRDAHESVGLIATKDGRPCVIEYSEISNELAEATDEDGLLLLRAGNIVNHYYSVELLKEKLSQWCDSMPYHIAKKKIQYFDNTSNTVVKPEEPNGIKLEQFIFDVFPTSSLERFGCLEVDRTKEFSPLKNGLNSKNDNSETSRQAYLTLGTSWLKQAGAIVRNNALVEVSNTLSYSGENLTKFKGTVFDKDGLYLE
ncbi:UDP-N-acetylglucosamine diphosphorylase KNAG_0A05640 [Huiozyma naganishii CBS 8797]|uniref:UDP-N-acetylglucosamine diphosphorylase n=1 Tax=Huiozyma naganishii (strain ATCC MYA-139 / BCRC 22969 / CBS 8797 / KCTC 17520 / NBRC 10181 / NCYC 3082 / Yp74L-3) TaxID=1071383 RepID=J7RF91_HUIN7|nr:hypothetical protein KNAG_0A05640 [Kazachstania naganishii CBS 8797]CCK68228.1 hypothetical protein KNAG_0A05640 [Kazachstania naganishii CBS 8797]